MLCAMKVFGRMLVFRGIAATNMPAFQAESEMDPGVAAFQALLAALGRSRRDRPDLVLMSTRFHVSPSFQ